MQDKHAQQAELKAWEAKLTTAVASARDQEVRSAEEKVAKGAQHHREEVALVQETMKREADKQVADAELRLQGDAALALDKATVAAQEKVCLCV